MAQPDRSKVENGSASSYTMLQVGDVEAIGAHCQMAFCHQLDFLPFRCDSCHLTFCLDHRSETAHKCAKEGEWARRRDGRTSQTSTSTTTATTTLSQKPTLQTGTQCYQTQCRTFVDSGRNTGVRCSRCNRTYCLKHRMQEDHDCKNVVPLGGRPGGGEQQQTNVDKIRLGFGKLRTWSKTQQTRLEDRLPKPKPSTAATRLAELGKLKREAKGDDKVPADKRLFLHVEAERSTASAKFPEAKLFFNCDWTVGRMLDEAAKRLQVANLNNMAQTEEQRLRIYHVEGGRLLEFGEKLQTCLQSGNTVVLLRGVGPAQ
ncbi:hypothetical protein DV735_g2849, partial [Chaetothyriales sp. CBS 134920]